MGEIKQVIVVRTDLEMGKGKIAAQVGHACVMGAEHVRKSNPEWFNEWWTGQETHQIHVRMPTGEPRLRSPKTIANHACSS